MYPYIIGQPRTQRLDFNVKFTLMNVVEALKVFNMQANYY